LNCFKFVIANLILFSTIASANPTFEQKPTAQGVLRKGIFIPITEGSAKLGNLRADISEMASLRINDLEHQLIGTVRLKTDLSSDLKPSFALQLKQDETLRRAGVELGSHITHGNGKTRFAAIPLGVTHGLYDGQISPYAGIVILSEHNIANILQLEAALESGLDPAGRGLGEFRARAGISKKIRKNGFIGAMMVFDRKHKVLNDSFNSGIREDDGPKIAVRAGFNF